MINIRLGLFETNSSSTHSIFIAPSSEGIYETLPVYDGIVYLTGGEFGWEYEKYNDAETKANYAAVFCFDDGKMKEMLIDVIKKHTGAKEVKFDFSLEYDPNDENKNYSYIDHQSALYEGGDCLRAFAGPDTLKEWIFNPKSYLQTDNDNRY